MPSCLAACQGASYHRLNLTRTIHAPGCPNALATGEWPPGWPKCPDCHTMHADAHTWNPATRTLHCRRPSGSLWFFKKTAP